MEGYASNKKGKQIHENLLVFMKHALTYEDLYVKVPVLYKKAKME